MQQRLLKMIEWCLTAFLELELKSQIDFFQAFHSRVLGLGGVLLSHGGADGARLEILPGNPEDVVHVRARIVPALDSRLVLETSRSWTLGRSILHRRTLWTSSGLNFSFGVMNRRSREIERSERLLALLFYKLMNIFLKLSNLVTFKIQFIIVSLGLWIWTQNSRVFYKKN